MVWSRLKATLIGPRTPVVPAPDPDAPPRAVPEGSAVYAVGDIHGRLDLLAKLMSQIADHAARLDCARKVVVFVGDYVDRGPDSKGVIDFLLDLPGRKAAPEFTLKCLIGNHERMMLDFLVEPEAVGQMWLRNGGLETLRSYGVGFDGAAPRVAAFQAARDGLAAALPARHKEFLDRLLLTHREGDYLFVHAGLKPGVALDEQREADMLWIRGPFLHTPADYGCLVVHGHTITPEPEWEAWRIGIDTGAFYTGRLTALALVGARQEIIQAVG
jgi:serine/threonine protein phosphatase 1